MNIFSVPFPHERREKGQPCQVIKSKYLLLTEWKALGVSLTDRLQTSTGIQPLSLYLLCSLRNPEPGTLQEADGHLSELCD